MPSNTRVVTAHVPNPLAQQVDAAAARLDHPRGWIVREALTAWLANEDRRHALTLEGLADVDAGRVVDQQSVQAWAESLSTDQPQPLPR